MRVFRYLAAPILIGALVMPVSQLIGESAAYASTTCSTDSGAALYSWGGYKIPGSDIGYTGIEGDINYSSGDITLDNNSNDHGLMYVDNDSTISDPNNGLYDWLQTGYAVGNIDTRTFTSPVVYAETSSPNNLPTATPFDSLSLGNHWFTVYYSGTTYSYNGTTYGKYLAFYGLGSNQTQTGYSYLNNYGSTRVFAQIEGATADGSGDYCPKFSQSLFGTNGNTSNPGYTQSTVLEFQKDSGGGWTNWTSGTAGTTQNHFTSPYTNANNYDSYAAWNATGGG